jgi:prepilin peptidase CpaA
MPTHPLFLLLALFVAAAAAWTDWRTGTIPNRLTFGALLLAPVAHFTAAILLGHSHVAFEAAGMSVVGAAACGLVPFLMYRSGGMAGGDVKLLAALGAICLLMFGIEVQVFGLFFATFYAAGVLAYKGRLFSTAKNMLALAMNPLRKKENKQTVCKELMTQMRFGPSVLAGVVVASVMQVWWQQ